MDFTKLQSLEKLSSLVQKHGSLAFSNKIFKKTDPKIKSLKVLNSCLLQAKKLVIPFQKHGGKGGPVLSFATKIRIPMGLQL